VIILLVSILLLLLPPSLIGSHHTVTTWSACIIYGPRKDEKGTTSLGGTHWFITTFYSRSISQYLIINVASHHEGECVTVPVRVLTSSKGL
jgi:hypothetical protein